MHKTNEKMSFLYISVEVLEYLSELQRESASSRACQVGSAILSKIFAKHRFLKKQIKKDEKVLFLSLFCLLLKVLDLVFYSLFFSELPSLSDTKTQSLCSGRPSRVFHLYFSAFFSLLVCFLCFRLYSRESFFFCFLPAKREKNDRREREENSKYSLVSPH